MEIRNFAGDFLDWLNDPKWLFHLMDKRQACLVAEKHFVKIGSLTGFMKKLKCIFIKD